jgi:hypothetical protein
MRCQHRQAGRIVVDWLPGRVSAADHWMLGVIFAVDVFANTGQAVPDRTLWCTHGSPNLRRPGDRAEADSAAEENSHD